MKIGNEISEDEVVAEFLRGEIQSKRFSHDVITACRDLGVDEQIIYEPDINNQLHNSQREGVLRAYRGWKEGRGIFQNVPERLRWVRAEISRSEVLELHYIDYSYWNELSRGTHLVADGVQRVREGVEVFDVSNEGFWQVAQAIERGVIMPPLILLEKGGILEVLEGHLRSTAFGLAVTCSEPIPVIIGQSE